MSGSEDPPNNPEQSGRERVSTSAKPSELDGVGRKYSQRLENAGYTQVQDLRGVSAETLMDKAGLPEELAESVVDQVRVPPGQAVSSLAQARSEAKGLNDAEVKTVKIGGRQRHKVMRKEREVNLAGATVTIRKG